jgi:hypothetical protein
LLARSSPGLRFNEHLDEADGPLVFAHACKLGLEGIVSKRRNSPYRSGRSPDWIKSKSPSAPAVRREAEAGNKGPPRRIAAVRRFGRDRSEADMPRASGAGRSDENDPIRS